MMINLQSIMPEQSLLEHNKENIPSQMYTTIIGKGLLLLEVFC